MKVITARFWTVAHRVAGLGVLVSCLGDTACLRACGPFFPDSSLTTPLQGLLASPRGAFGQELLRIGRDLPPCELRAVAEPEKEAERWAVSLELTSLRACLLARGLSDPQLHDACDSYRAVRREIAEWAPSSGEAAAGKQPDWSFDACIPRGFDRYLRGVLAWRRGDEDEARRHWEAVLALPSAEAGSQAPAAAYMLGRLASEVYSKCNDKQSPAAQAAADEAERRFAQVREGVRLLHEDPRGLGAASLGQQALVALRRGAHARALQLYFEQHRAGDPSAFQSLRVTLRRAREAGGEALSGLAGDPLARRIMGAYLVSLARESVFDEYGSENEWTASARQWLEFLDQQPEASLSDADRLAWVYYEGGRFELAARWLAHAPEEAPLALWLRGKLALRDGKPQEAGRFYARALSFAGDDLSAAQRVDLRRELARIRLQEDRFAEAADLWLAADDWEGAAYVLERLLQTDELLAWQETRATALATDPHGKQVRDLIGRRLAREGDARASAFFSGSLQRVHALYRESVRRGYDAQLPNEQRAEAFFLAARLARHFGLEMLGTELEPDWAVYGACYELTPDTEQRQSHAEGPLRLSRLETERLITNPAPTRRYHYRYRAAELAEYASWLLPNNSERLSEVLCEAGAWIRQRSPGEAQSFYKALVLRCPDTPLGREALRLHWFPDYESNFPEHAPQELSWLKPLYQAN